MAGVVGQEALPESQRPGPGYGWVLGTRQVLPGPLLTNPVRQSCCHENPGLTLGPSPLQAAPPSTVPLSSLCIQITPVLPSPPSQEAVHPPLLPSLALEGPPMTYVCGLSWSIILPHQPFPLGVFMVGGLLSGSIPPKKISIVKSIWEIPDDFFFCRTCQSL